MDTKQIAFRLKREFNYLKHTPISVIKEFSFTKKETDSLLSKVDTETKKELYSPHESIRFNQDENHCFYGKKGK